MTRTRHNLNYLKNFRKKLRGRATKSEVVLWSHIHGNALGAKFRRQHSIGQYVADFYCPELGIVIELDGVTHNDPHVKKKDLEKENYLKGLDKKILRFTDNQVVGDVDSVLEVISTLINQCTTTPNPSSTEEGSN